MSVPATATEGDGLLAAQGLVSLTLPAASDLEVTLVVDDASEVVLPQTSVIIPAGTYSATFDLLIQDDAILDGSHDVTVSASAADYVDGSAVLTIHDNESAALTLALPASGAEGDGVLVGAATLGVDTAPEEDVRVNLTSLDETEVICPDFVILPAGETSVTFDVEIVDDEEIDGTIPVLVAASVVNWSPAMDSTVVTDNDAVLNLVLPSSVWEGDGTATARIEIGGRNSEDVVVALESSDPASLGVPDSVTIEAGQLYADFALDIVDDSLLDGARTATIGATAAGLAPDSTDLTVHDDDVDHFEIDPIGDPQTAAEAFNVTVTAKNIDGETIAPYEAPLAMTVTGATGELPFEFAAKGTLPEYVPYSTKFGTTSSDDERETLGTYHDYAGVTDFLSAYATDYSGICSLVSLGQSVQGRELWAMKISDNPLAEEDEPEFKYVSTMHGDEAISLEMTLYLVDEILTGYGTDADLTELVDGTEIWIVPLMNPDGLEAGTRYNANGVDLNRAFPDGFVSNIGTAYTDPLEDVSGFEPEVAAIMQWGAASSASLSANLHSGSLLVNYPYDNDGLGNVDSPTPDDALFEVLAETYSSLNSPMWNSSEFYHGISNGAAWYTVDGGMQDWNYRYLSCNEVTIELSDVKMPAEDLIDDFWGDNRDSMVAYMEAVHLGVRGLVTDAVTGDPVYATISVAGNSHPVYSDADVGDYHRLLLPGTYELTISAPGYSSKTVSGVVVDGTATTRVDAELNPLSDGLAFSGGIWSGQIAVGAVDTDVRVRVGEGTAAESESNSFAVVSGPVSGLAFAPLPDTEYSDVPFDVTLSTVDSNGFVAGDYNGAFSLTATAGGSPDLGLALRRSVRERRMVGSGDDFRYRRGRCAHPRRPTPMTASSESFEIVLRPPLELDLAGEVTEGDGLIEGDDFASDGRRRRRRRFARIERRERIGSDAIEYYHTGRTGVGVGVVHGYGRRGSRRIATGYGERLRGRLSYRFGRSDGSR